MLDLFSLFFYFLLLVPLLIGLFYVLQALRLLQIGLREKNPFKQRSAGWPLVLSSLLLLLVYLGWRYLQAHPTYPFD